MTLITTNLTDGSGAALLGGGWDFIKTQVASGNPTIDVINLSSDYFVYKFIWSGLAPATESTTKFYIRTSSTNGSTWDGGGTNYAWSNHRVSMTGSPAHDPEGDNSDSEIQINGNDALGTNANELMDLEITLFNPSGTEYTKFKWEGVYFDNAATPLGNHIIGAGVRLSAADVNGVRFLMSSGNIASGTLWVYGIKAT